jgi:hypothetical protein
LVGGDKMIDFIYVVVIVAYILLALGFGIKDYALTLLSSFIILISGIYLAIYGITDVDTFLTQSFGVINIGIGAYVLIAGSIEMMGE